MRFKTESGSTYSLNKKKMTWKRLGTTSKSGPIRNEHGHLITWPYLAIGFPAFLQDDTIKEGFNVHIVRTSLVTEIL